MLYLQLLTIRFRLLVAVNASSLFRMIDLREVKYTSKYLREEHAGTSVIVKSKSKFTMGNSILKSLSLHGLVKNTYQLKFHLLRVVSNWSFNLSLQSAQVNSSKP